MIKSSLVLLYRLRLAMRRLETELGLTDLTPTELDALAVVFNLTSTREHFRAKDVVKHRLLSNVSRATQYRTIQALEDKGFIVANAGSVGTFRLFEEYTSHCATNSLDSGWLQKQRNQRQPLAKE